MRKIYQLNIDSAYFVLRLSVIISKIIIATTLSVQRRIKFQKVPNKIHSLSRNSADDVAIKLK
jgi:hypothetical protein